MKKHVQHSRIVLGIVLVRVNAISSHQMELVQLMHRYLVDAGTLTACPMHKGQSQVIWYQITVAVVQVIIVWLKVLHNICYINPNFI